MLPLIPIAIAVVIGIAIAAANESTNELDREPIDDLEDTPAYAMMRRANANALIGEEDGLVCMVEDHADPDGRVYRIEYQALPDGENAIAWCRYNPWGRGPNAGASYGEAHVRGDGLLCLGHGATDVVEDSPYDLNFALARGRFWCTAFSVFKESGRFPKA